MAWPSFELLRAVGLGVEQSRSRDPDPGARSLDKPARLILAGGHGVHAVVAPPVEKTAQEEVMLHRFGVVRQICCAASCCGRHREALRLLHVRHIVLLHVGDDGVSLLRG